MTIGRNAPCPCGSGKKYKKCCLNKPSTISSSAVHYRRLSKVHDQLVDRLLRLGRDTFGDAGTMEAIDEFWGWPESDEDLAPTEERLDRTAPLFWPWFLFCWYYDPQNVDDMLDYPANLTVAELYAQQCGPAIDSLEEAIITAFVRKPYSFYEALAVDPGHSAVLKDILTGRTITVQERMGTEVLKPADIVFGRAEMVDGVGMIVGLGTTIIPPRFKPQLIDLRKKLRKGHRALTDEQVYDWDLDIRRFYLDLEEHLHRPPQLTNTDGDPLEFHKLVYTVESAEIAFRKLASLCVTDTPADLGESAVRDSAGRIREVAFSWNRKGFKGQQGVDHTLLGHIRIQATTMTIEVNSAARAATIRRTVERRLGAAARFRLDEIQDTDTMMRRAMEEGAPAGPAMDMQALMNHPEMLAQVGEMMAKHWEGWVDEKLPALNGKTPRKAVTTADGREAVEALLIDFERQSDDADPMAVFNRRGFARIREMLGLPPATT